MAAYPTTIGRKERVRPLTDRKVDVSDSGRVRSIDLGEVTAVEIDIEHPLITAAEVLELRNFYAANRGVVNTITAHGVSYNVHFASDYTFETESAAYSNAMVRLIGEPA